MSAITLLPCPFCGGSARFTPRGEVSYGMICGGCADPNCLGHQAAYDFVSQETCAAAWNTRAMIAATQQPAGEGEPWYGDRDPQEVDQAYGEYDGSACEMCGRERVMTGAATGKRICEKCGHYQSAALSATQQPVSEGVGWRPIETAPRDGTAVDLWIAWSADDQRRIPDAFWGRAEPAFGGGVGEGWVDPSGGFGGECGLISSEAEALFWMPLPPAPSPIGEEKGAES